MARYYGVQRSEEYLEHYGVKGMKWGVRKAIEKGNHARLEKHYAKAVKKLDRLKGKTNLTRAADNALAGRSMGRVGGAITGLEAGLSGALLATSGKSALPAAALFTGGTLPLTITGAALYGVNKRRLSSKGHQKAVDKVKKWETAMDDAFKGTSYQNPNDGQKFDDTYRIVDLKKNQRTGHYQEYTKAKIKGSHLTSDYHGADKKKFLKTAGQYVDSVDPKKGFVVRSIQASHDNGINAADPLAFAYNMHEIHRKRGQKKKPFYRSSKEAYRQYYQL